MDNPKPPAPGADKRPDTPEPPTQQEFDNFVRHIMTVPKGEVEKKAKKGRRRKKQDRQQ